MSWRAIDTLGWEEPLTLAAHHAGGDMALLYSAFAEPFTGQHSYLFTEPLAVCEGSDWAALPPLPATADDLPLWVGYLGYGLREHAARGAPSPIELPDFRLVRYRHLWRFDHRARAVDRFTWAYEGASLRAERRNPAPTRAKSDQDGWLRSARNDAPPLASNLSRNAYETAVARTLGEIEAGNFYQANITRKFWGRLPAHAAEATPFDLFQRLCDASPAPMSAFIQQGDTAILSSSPESFLTLDAGGTLTTRPIKGSARRSDDAEADHTTRERLAESAKNLAENLMIVDLMRNDLARVSTPGSVRVVEQAQLYSYRTIHHLISTIEAQKQPEISAYEAVAACFPPGSMTGAPKRAAIRWCEGVEGMERGVYSGAMGWFGAGERCDLSVVIRTLILRGDQFEFQVGGGIVADSTPEDEWRETLAKARGILSALGLDEGTMAEV